MNKQAGYNAVMKTAGLGKKLMLPIAGAALGGGLGYATQALPHSFDWKRDHFLWEPYYRPKRFYERWGIGHDDEKAERRGAIGGALAGGLAGTLGAISPAALKHV